MNKMRQLASVAGLASLLSGEPAMASAPFLPPNTDRQQVSDLENMPPLRQGLLAVVQKFQAMQLMWFVAIRENDGLLEKTLQEWRDRFPEHQESEILEMAIKDENKKHTFVSRTRRMHLIGQLQHISDRLLYIDGQMGKRFDLSRLLKDDALLLQEMGNVSAHIDKLFTRVPSSQSTQNQEQIQRALLYWQLHNRLHRLRYRPEPSKDTPTKRKV